MIRWKSKTTVKGKQRERFLHLTVAVLAQGIVYEIIPSPGLFYHDLIAKTWITLCTCQMSVDLCLDESLSDSRPTSVIYWAHGWSTISVTSFSPTDPALQRQLKKLLNLRTILFPLDFDSVWWMSTSLSSVWDMRNNAFRHSFTGFNFLFILADSTQLPLPLRQLSEGSWPLMYYGGYGSRMNLSHETIWFKHVQPSY